MYSSGFGKEFNGCVAAKLCYTTYMLGLSLWWRLLVFVIGWAIGFWFLLKPLQAAYYVGTQQWAERRFGAGGTYTGLKLIGIALIIIAFIILVKG